MDYQVKIRVRNGRIVRRMRECGIDSLAELVRRVGKRSDYPLLCNLIGMKETPLTQKGDWRPVVLRLCEVLNCIPEDLFNERQMTTPIRKNEAETFVDEAQLVSIMRHGVEATEAKLTVERLLNSLSPRHRGVVEARLEGATYTDIAEDQHVCVGTIRRIERQAMLKLKKAARPKLLVTA